MFRVSVKIIYYPKLQSHRMLLFLEENMLSYMNTDNREERHKGRAAESLCEAGNTADKSLGS